MAWWRRVRRGRRHLDRVGPATIYLTQSGAYLAPTWATEPTRIVSTVGVLTVGQASSYGRYRGAS
jgi:hypothetical protein